MQIFFREILENEIIVKLIKTEYFTFTISIFYMLHIRYVNIICGQSLTICGTVNRVSRITVNKSHPKSYQVKTIGLVLPFPASIVHLFLMTTFVPKNQVTKRKS